MELSTILYLCYTYWNYDLFALFEEAITNQSNIKSIRNMAKYSRHIKIYRKTKDRNYKVFEYQSINLAPGDV
jgi:hypothetical protein